MPSDLLLVDDLMLLLLHDDGSTIAGAGTLHYTLGGALVMDLALGEHIALEDEGRRSLNGPRIEVTAGASPADPLLAASLERLRAKQQRLQPAILTLGAGLYTTILERLEERGLIRREQRTRLGIFRTTRWPAADTEHEAQVRERIVAVLTEGAEPDLRTAALIGLVHASGQMPALHPPLPWTKQSIARAQAIQQGDWGASAVGTAISRHALAVTLSAASAGIAAATAANQSP